MGGYVADHHGRPAAVTDLPFPRWMIELAFIKALRTWPEGERLEYLKGFYVTLDDYLLTEQDAAALKRQHELFDEVRQRGPMSDRELALLTGDAFGPAALRVRQDLVDKGMERLARIEKVLGTDRPVLGPPKPSFAEWIWQVRARMTVAQRVGFTLGLIFGSAAFVLTRLAGWDNLAAGVAAVFGFLAVNAPVAGTGIERYGHGVAAGLLNAATIIVCFCLLAWLIWSSLGWLAFIVAPIAYMAIFGANMAATSWLARAAKREAS